MEKTNQLNKLIERNKILKPIVFVSFNTDIELIEYRKKIQNERNEYYNNFEKIEKLKWELKTPEEQKAETELLEKMKLKRDGNL